MHPICQANLLMFQLAWVVRSGLAHGDFGRQRVQEAGSFRNSLGGRPPSITGEKLDLIFGALLHGGMSKAACAVTSPLSASR
jgi:hypothetical protein